MSVCQGEREREINIERVRGRERKYVLECVIVCVRKSVRQRERERESVCEKKKKRECRKRHLQKMWNLVTHLSVCLERVKTGMSTIT